jgi:hypothetical protein
MTAALVRHAQGSGSVYPYKRGYAAYVWVDQPDGSQIRRFVYGRDRASVTIRWQAMRDDLASRPRSKDLDEVALSIVCDERVAMRLLGDDRIEAVRRLVAKGCNSPEIADLLKTTTNMVANIRSSHNIVREDRDPWSWTDYIYGRHRSRGRRE